MSFRTNCEWPVNYLIICCHVFEIPKHCKLQVARKKTTMAGTHDVDRLAIGNAELRVDYLCLQENLCFKMSIYIYKYIYSEVYIYIYCIYIYIYVCVCVISVQVDLFKTLCKSHSLLLAVPVEIASSPASIRHPTRFPYILYGCPGIPCEAM